MGYSLLAILAGVCEMIARALVGFALVPIFGYIIICFASPLAWLMADAFLIPGLLLLPAEPVESTGKLWNK